jgi:hypothetical protein
MFFTDLKRFTRAQMLIYILSDGDTAPVGCNTSGPACVNMKLQNSSDFTTGRWNQMSKTPKNVYEFCSQLVTLQKRAGKWKWKLETRVLPVNYLL